MILCGAASRLAGLGLDDAFCRVVCVFQRGCLVATVWCKVVGASVSAPAAHFINVHVRSFCLTSQAFAFSLLGLILSLLALTLAPGVQVQHCCTRASQSQRRGDRTCDAMPARTGLCAHARTRGAQRQRAAAARQWQRPSSVSKSSLCRCIVVCIQYSAFGSGALSGLRRPPAPQLRAPGRASSVRGQGLGRAAAAAQRRQRAEARD